MASLCLPFFVLLLDAPGSSVACFHLQEAKGSSAGRHRTQGLCGPLHMGEAELPGLGGRCCVGQLSPPGATKGE